MVHQKLPSSPQRYMTFSKPSTMFSTRFSRIFSISSSDMIHNCFTVWSPRAVLASWVVSLLLKLCHSSPWLRKNIQITLLGFLRVQRQTMHSKIIDTRPFNYQTAELQVSIQFFINMYFLKNTYTFTIPTPAIKIVIS